MSLIALYLLFISLIISAIGFYVYFTSQKNELNRVFFALALFWAYWHFIEFGLRTSESVDMVVAWSVLGALRLGVVPLILHFFLLYRKDKAKNRTFASSGALYSCIAADRNRSNRGNELVCAHTFYRRMDHRPKEHYSYRPSGWMDFHHLRINPSDGDYFLPQRGFARKYAAVLYGSDGPYGAHRIDDMDS